MAEQRIILSFHDRLAEALSLRHMKPIDLAKETGISRGAISQYINGKVKPKQDKVAKMANALRVSPAWLMGYDVAIDDNDDVQHGYKNKTRNEANRDKYQRWAREVAIRRKTKLQMEVSLYERALIENFRAIQALRIQNKISDLVELLAYPDLASLPPNSELSDVELKEMLKRRRGDLVDEPDDLDSLYMDDMDDIDE